MSTSIDRELEAVAQAEAQLARSVELAQEWRSAPARARLAAAAPVLADEVRRLRAELDKLKQRAVPTICWEAPDGRVFTDRAAADEHGLQLAQVERILSGLRPRPKKMGHGTYTQQPIDAVWAARAEIVRHAPELEPWRTETLALIEKRTLPQHSVIGRALDGGDPFSLAWSRLECIDAVGREWEQHYFALHPEKGAGEWAP